MSIEAALAELTKEIRELKEDVRKSNDLNERMIGLKAEAIETVKTTAAKPEAAEKPKAAPKQKAEEPKAEEPKAEETKPEEAPKVEEPKAEAPKLDPLGQAIADYVTKGYDSADPMAKEERAARSQKVKDIFAAVAKKKGITVAKHSDIPEDMHGSVLKTLAARAAEGNLVIGKASEEAEDELLG